MAAVSSPLPAAAVAASPYEFELKEETKSERKAPMSPPPHTTSPSGSIDGLDAVRGTIVIVNEGDLTATRNGLINSVPAREAAITTPAPRADAHSPASSNAPAPAQASAVPVPAAAAVVAPAARSSDHLENEVVQAPSCVIMDGSVVHLHLKTPTYALFGQPKIGYVAFVRDTAVAPSELIQHKLFALHREHDAVVLLAPLTASETKVSAWSGRVSKDEPCRWVEASVRYVPSRERLFARNKGLLANEVLSHKSVGIVGLGSGGAPIALDLARSGVGRFVLIDFDDIELHNVARHVCDCRDLGRLKVHAMADKLRAINPYVDVECYAWDVCKQRSKVQAMLNTCHLIVAGTDNNESRFALNEIALELQLPAVFGRVLSRGCGGDVVRVRPGTGGPCLSCVITKAFLEATLNTEKETFDRARAAAPSYISDEDVMQSLQVGLSCDIAPVTNLMVKLSLVELSRGVEGSGLKALEDDLKPDFYMWANRREANFAPWAPLECFKMGQRPTLLQWIGVPVRPRCEVCTPRVVPAELAALNAENADFFKD